MDKEKKSKNQEQTAGYIYMPLKSNVPTPRDTWEPAICPICGAECWKQPAAKRIALILNYKAVCSKCALCALEKAGE